MTQAFGAVDLYSGNSITGTDLFSTNKNPTNTLSTNTGTLASNPETFVNMLTSMLKSIPELIGVIFEFILLIPIILLEFIFAIGSALLDGLCSIFTGQQQTGTTNSSFLSGTQSALNNFCGLFTGSAMPLGVAGDTSGATVFAGVQGAISTGSTMLTGDSSIGSGSGLFSGAQGLMDNFCGLYTGGSTTGTSGNTVFDGVQGAIATGSTVLTGGTSIGSGSGLASSAQTAANNFCGLFTGDSLPMRGVANTDVPTVFAGVQGAISTGSTMLTGDSNAYSSGTGLFSGGQGLMDGLCSTYTGQQTTGTNGNTVYDGVQGVIATGSDVITGGTTISSGSGLLGGGINLMNALCGLCSGGLGMTRGRTMPAAHRRLGLPEPMTNGAAILSGAQGWVATGSYHLTGNANTITSATGLATAAQGHLDTVAGFVGGAGSGNAANAVITQGLQYQSDAVSLLGNPTGLGTGSPQAPPVAEIPLLGQQSELTSAPVVDALTQTSWFDDLQTVLGNPNGLGSGTPTANPSISNVPILAPAGAAQAALVDYIYGGISGVTNTGHSVADVGNALSGLSSTATTAATQAQTGVTYVELMAVNSPGHHALDPSLVAVFDLTTITGSSPDTLSVTELASAIGFIHIPSNASKASMAFIGVAPPTGITDVYLNLFSVNKSTGVMTLQYQSANIASSIGTATYDWIYIAMPSVTVSQGDWWAVELAVVGSGALTIVGLPSHWMPINGNVYPKQLGATRDTTLPTLDVGSTFGSTTSATTGSWSHTLDPGAAAIFVILNVTNFTGAQTASAKIGSMSMTQIEALQYDPGAPVFDAVGGGFARTTSTTSLSGSWSHTATAGAAVLVAVVTNASAAVSGFTRTATYGGTSMTSLGVINNDASASGWTEVFGLNNVAGGAQTVAVTSTGGTVNCADANSVSYLNVASFGTVVTNDNGGASATSGTVTSAVGQTVAQVFGGCSSFGQTSPSAYSATQRYQVRTAGASSTDVSLTMGDAPGAASVSFTETAGGSAVLSGSVAVPLIGGVTGGWLYAFELDSPPTGAQTVSFTLGVAGKVSGTAVSYTGASTASDSSAVTATGSGTSLSQSVTAATGQILLQAFANDSGGGTLTSYSQTSIASEAGSANHQPLLTGQVASSGSSQTFSATASVSALWGSLIIPVASPYIPPPTTISAPTYSSNIPWMALSSENVTTAGTFAPTQTPYLTPGTYTFAIPFWVSFIDLVGIGAGGAGAYGAFFAVGNGGNAGTWVGKIIERGVDFKDDPNATLTIVVGAPGAGAGAVSTMTYTDPSNVPHTVTGAGGSTATQSGGGGQAAVNFIFDGETYRGGAANSSPGGGGDGAGGFGQGMAGGPGAVWITCLAAAGLAREIPLPAALAGHGVLSATAGVRVMLTGHGALFSPVKAKIKTPTASQGTLTVAARMFSIQEPAVLAGHGVLSAAARMFSTTRSAALSGSGLLVVPVRGHADLPGHGALSATARPGKLVAFTAGHGALSATAITRYSRSAALTGHGALTTAVKVTPGMTALSGHGGLTVSRVSPVAFDAVGSVGNFIFNATSKTTDTVLAGRHSATGGANNVVLLFIDGECNASTTISLTASYGGTPMTQLDNFNYFSSSSDAANIAVFYLFNPPTGTQTVSVTQSTTASGAYFLTAQTVSYNNVASLGSVSLNSGTATSTSLAVTCPSHGAVAMMFGTTGGAGTFALSNLSNAGATTRFNNTTASTGLYALIGDSETAGTVNFAATMAATGPNWGGIGVPLTPA